MAMNQNVSNVVVGSTETIDPNAKVIRWEVSNDKKVIMWRIHGEVHNPECEFVVYDGNRCIFIRDGRLQDVKNPGRYRVYPELDDQPKHWWQRKKNVEVNEVIDLIYFPDDYRIADHWGAGPIEAHDPRASVLVHARCFGDVTVKVKDPYRFFNRYGQGTQTYTFESFWAMCGGTITSTVSTAIPAIMEKNAWSYVNVYAYRSDLEKGIMASLNEKLNSEFGLEVTAFAIVGMSIDPEEAKEIERILAERGETKPAEPAAPAPASPAPGQTKVCPYCKTVNHINATVCNTCGGHLD